MTDESRSGDPVSRRRRVSVQRDGEHCRGGEEGKRHQRPCGAGTAPEFQFEGLMRSSRRCRGRERAMCRPCGIRGVAGSLWTPLSLSLLLLLSSMGAIQAAKLSDTQAMYTGVVRSIGSGDSSHVLSFGPDNAEILLRLCVQDGASGRGLAADPTPEDPEAMSVSCIKEYEEAGGSSKSAPSAGVSAYDPISQVWFHANGEDGFASAYVTGVNTIRHGSIGQSRVENEDMETSFTLSAIEYNRADDSLFGVVTYSSGQHYVVAITGSKSEPIWDPAGTGRDEAPGSQEGFYSSSDQIQQKWDRVIKFRHIYRLREATGVVPALSGMEPIRQMYMCVVLEEDAPYLYTVASGMDQGGNPIECGLNGVPYKTSADELACPECSGCLLRKTPMPGVATSMEVYYTTIPYLTEPKHPDHHHIHEGDRYAGFVYMLVYNSSGHFFMQYDIDTGVLYSEHATQVEDADTRVVFGLSAFAPGGFGMVWEDDEFYGMEGPISASAKKLATYSYMTRDREIFVNKTNQSHTISDLKVGELHSLSWGHLEGTINKAPDVPLTQRNNVSIEPDVTFVSLEAQLTTIPVAEYTYPLYSHVDGGGIINVLGGPFVDAPSLSCKWTVIEPWCKGLSAREFTRRCLIYSEQTIYVNATYIVCKTPPVSGALSTKMTVSLSGVVWSFETEDVFIFFTTGNPVGRKPLFGSSKGLNALQIKGVNIRLLSWDSKDQLADSRCEFGEYTDLETYMTDDKMTFNSETCENITIGPVTEVYCAFTCKSPQIPHEYCLYQGQFRLCPLHSNFTVDKCQHLCTDFVPECPKGTNDVGDLLGKCRPLLEFNLNVPMRLGMSPSFKPGAALFFVRQAHIIRS